MSYASFAHLFFAKPHLLDVIKAEYGPDCFTNDDTVVDAKLPSYKDIVAYIDLTGNIMTVLPCNESAHKILTIDIDDDTINNL